MKRQPKISSNPHVAAYFCDSPCRVCGADKSWFNLVVNRYVVIARVCLRCEHKEKALIQFYCGGAR